MPYRFRSIMLVSLSALLALGGCVVTTNDQATSECSLDSSVTCGGSSQGYSCNASDITPTQSNSALSCGVPVTGADGRYDYCCSTAVAASCTVDATASCATGTAYSCTGSATPPQSNPALLCGGGTSQSDGTIGYCCTTSTCSADSSVACTNGASGYSCTGSDTPDQTDTLITCGPGTADGSVIDYCCTSTTSTCNADSSVVCSGNASGYSCSGSDTPDQTDSSLVCSTGAPNGSVTDYCCAASSTSSCSADASVTCTGGASGYICTGSETPDQTDTSIVCSVGAPNGMQTAYCCMKYSSSDCLEDPSVQGCQAGSYGFSCTDGTTPDQADPSLTCSAGTPGPNGETLFCCSK